MVYNNIWRGGRRVEQFTAKNDWVGGLGLGVGIACAHLQVFRDSFQYIIQQSTVGNRRCTYYEVRNNLYLWWHCWEGTLFILGVPGCWQDIRNRHYYLLMSWEHRQRKIWKKYTSIDCDDCCKYLALFYCAPPNIDRVKNRPSRETIQPSWYIEREWINI